MNLLGIGRTGYTLDLSQVAQKRLSTPVRDSFSIEDYSDENGADTVNISSRRAIEMADSRVSTFQKTLTTSDKELIRGSTGWDIDTDPSGATAPEGARRFALRLMLDRYSLTTYGGADGFTGQVDQSYIQHVIQEQLGGQGMVPLSVLYKVQSYLSSQTTTKTP